MTRLSPGEKIAIGILVVECSVMGFCAYLLVRTYHSVKHKRG